MRNGFKIVDTDTHHMEPTPYSGSNISSPASRPPHRAWVARASGRTHLDGRGRVVDRARRESIRWRRPVSSKRRRKAMQRFESTESAGFSADRRVCRHGREGRRCADHLSDRARARCSGGSSTIPSCSRPAAAPTTTGAPNIARRDPKRLRWAAMLPMQDVEKSIKEARRAARKWRGQLLRAAQSGARPQPASSRLSAAVQGNRTSSASRFRPMTPASASVPSFGDRMETHVSGAHPGPSVRGDGRDGGAYLVWGLRAFPAAAVVHVEADGGWAPYWVQRMEQHWEFSGNAGASGPEDASDRLLQIAISTSRSAATS